MNQDGSRKSLEKLIEGNGYYIGASQNPANISQIRRTETAEHRQEPFAVILTCSGSRVPPEHIFSTGIGDLFVVRTAGNVVGDFELGSIEYAVAHLHAPLIVILGHTHCGAVEAALKLHAGGYIENIVREIQLGLHDAATEDEAIRNNILHSKQRLLQSKIVGALLAAGEIMLACAVYDIETGKVDFFQ